MRLKRFTLAIVAVMTVGLSSCFDTEDTVKLTNYINMGIAGLAYEWEVSEELTDPIVVNIQLTYFVEDQITIKFKLLENEGDILQIENSEVTIPANTKTGELTILPNIKEALTEAKTITLVMESSTNSCIALGNVVTIKVKPIEKPSTDEPSTDEPPTENTPTDEDGENE